MDSLKREELHEGMPGYYPKNQIRHRFCNAFHDEGLRCTRQMNHRPPHAAHVVMGVQGTTEEWINPATNEKEVRVKPGMKNVEDVQIATW